MDYYYFIVLIVCRHLKHRFLVWKTKFMENATLKYRTRNARIKFWWTRAAPIAFTMGAGAEYYKWTHSEKYRIFRLEGGQHLRPSAYEKEMYQRYLEKHGPAVMDSEHEQQPDADVQLVIDTIIKENVQSNE